MSVTNPAPIADIPAAGSDPDHRRLVLGAAVGFDVAQVRVFVESLRANYAGDVLLIRDPRRGVRGNPLHQHCAEKFYKNDFNQELSP